MVSNMAVRSQSFTYKKITIMNATELHPLIIGYICRKIEQSLYRLGINTTVTAETRKDYAGNPFLYFQSQPFTTTPAIFKTIFVKGAAFKLFETEHGDSWLTLPVTLGYYYEHWEGGENGCNLGTMNFRIAKEYPTEMTNDGNSFNDVSYYVQSKGLRI